MGHNRTKYVAAIFEHLIGGREQGWRQGNAECLGGREIDDKFEFGGLLDRNVGGLRAFENFIYDRRTATRPLQESHAKA
jgi:hypothetical protein